MRMQGNPRQGCGVVTLWSWDLGSDPNSLLPICVTQGESSPLLVSAFMPVKWVGESLTYPLSNEIIPRE